MNGSTPVSLIRQTDALPLLEVLHEAGAPTERLLSESGLPESFEEARDGFIPFRTMLHFAGHAAQSQDIPDLCWRGVIKTRTESLGGWGEAVARCTTLRRAILTFCERFKRDAPLMDLGLEMGHEFALFWRRRPAHVIGWLGEEDGQQFAMAAMIRIVRAAAGPTWMPPHILLESKTARWTRNVRELAGTRIDLGCPVVAIALPYELLDRPTFWGDEDGLGLQARPKLLDAEQTLAGSLQQALSAMLPAVHPSIEEGAEIAELSPRRLSRRLHGEGTSWRRVVDQARLAACLRLLHDPNRPLSAIAMELGYSDQAHLTRAFRRWTGEPPGQYRRRQR